MKTVDGLMYADNDIEWSKVINAKNEGFCLLCPQPSTAAHIISRRFKNTRLAIDNGVPLCIKHHAEFDATSVENRAKAALLLIGGVYNKLKLIAKNNTDTGKEVVW